jgi:NAD(P)-dependent dehydrogenase (short-subunit alcohol dehydrogenase family)
VIAARTDQSETARLIADAGGEALALTLDMSNPASVEEARTRVEAGPGQVDILVNNAATFETATWDALDLELWHTQPWRKECRRRSSRTASGVR